MADGNGFVGEPTEGNPTKPPIFLNIPNLKDWVLTPKLDKSIVKGGEVSRAVPVNTDGLRAIDALVNWHREQYGSAEKKRPL